MSNFSTVTEKPTSEYSAPKNVFPLRYVLFKLFCEACRKLKFEPGVLENEDSSPLVLSSFIHTVDSGPKIFALDNACLQCRTNQFVGCQGRYGKDLTTTPFGDTFSIITAPIQSEK